MSMHFLGHDTSYWLELQKRFDDQGDLSAPGLLEEVVKLQGKVGFYESRIADMAVVARK